jgi:hypothetical protein
MYITDKMLKPNNIVRLYIVRFTSPYGFSQELYFAQSVWGFRPLTRSTGRIRCVVKMPILVHEHVVVTDILVIRFVPRRIISAIARVVGRTAWTLDAVGPGRSTNKCHQALLIITNVFGPCVIHVILLQQSINADASRRR